MSKYNFGKRLKRLVNREFALTKLETSIVKDLTKLKEDISTIESLIYNHWMELAVYSRTVNKLQHNNAKLLRFLNEERGRLYESTQMVAQIQQELDDRIDHILRHRQILSEQMDRLNCIKESTKTFINLKALPNTVQGVSVYEKKNSSEWSTFCINPFNHTQQEVQDILWTNPCSNDTFHQEWNYLFIDSLSNEFVANVNQEVTEIHQD